jgi:hypothetical protein
VNSTNLHSRFSLLHRRLGFACARWCASFSPVVSAVVAHTGRTALVGTWGVAPLHVSCGRDVFLLLLTVRDACTCSVAAWHPCPKPKRTSLPRNPNS